MPVRAPAAVLALARNVQTVPVATTTIAPLPVIITVIFSLGGPPADSTGLLVPVLFPVVEALLQFEWARALGVFRFEGRGRERGVGRMGVSHVVWRRVSHRCRRLWGRHGRRGHGRHHVRVVGVLRHQGAGHGGTGQGGRRKVRWLGEGWTYWKRVKRAVRRGRHWRRVRHEVRMWWHVAAAVPVETRHCGSLRVIIVRGYNRQRRWGPQSGGSVVLPAGHCSPGNPTILMERHVCRVGGKKWSINTLNNNNVTNVTQHSVCTKLFLASIVRQTRRREGQQHANYEA